VETLKDADLVALRRPVASHGLVAGDVGTVLHVYKGGEAYEVEFGTADGRTIAVITMPRDELEPVSGAQILHVRQLPPTSN
jgi:hypothetical protein